MTRVARSVHQRMKGGFGENQNNFNTDEEMLATCVSQITL